MIALASRLAGLLQRQILATAVDVDRADRCILVLAREEVGPEGLQGGASGQDRADVPTGADQARQGLVGFPYEDEVERILYAFAILAGRTAGHGFDRSAELGLAHVANLVRSIELLDVHVAVFDVEIGDPR